MYKIEITSVDCTHVGGGTKDDDVEIITQADGYGPSKCPVVGAHAMGSGDTWDLTNDGATSGQVYYFDNAFSIQLYDRDGVGNFVDAADLLFSGLVYFSSDDAPPPSPVNGSLSDTWEGSGARYTVNYTLSWVSAPPVPDNDEPLGDLFGAIADELTNWIKGDGAAIVAETDPQTLEDLLREALVSTAFRTVGDKLRSATKIKGLSLGVMAEADLCLGVTGAFGVAIARDDFQFIGMGGDKAALNSAIYAGGGLLEGVDVALDGTVAFGIWFEEPKDMSGRYIGADADLGDIEDVEGVVYASRSEDEDDLKEDGEYSVAKIREKAKVTFVGLGVGLGAGVDVQEAHFFSGALPGHTPCYQPGDCDHMVVVEHITCENTYSAVSNDQVMLHYYVDGDIPEYVEDGPFKTERYEAHFAPDVVPGQYRYPIWNTREMDDDDDFKWPAGPAIKFNSRLILDVHAAAQQPSEMDTRDNVTVMGIKDISVGTGSGQLKAPGDTLTLTYSYDLGALAGAAEYKVKVTLLY